MEFKVLIYLIGGIAYFVYSVYKKANEDKPEKVKPPKPTHSLPKKGWLDEAIEQMQKEVDKGARTSSPPSQPAKPIIKKQPKLHKRTTLLEEVLPPQIFVEGEAAEPTYKRPLTSEEILHAERMRASQSTGVMAENEEEPAYQLNVREAFIGSVIFERRF